MTKNFIDRIVKEKVVINAAYEFRAFIPEGYEPYWAIYRRKRGDMYARVKPVAYYHPTINEWIQYPKRSIECMRGYKDWPSNIPNEEIKYGP